MPYSKGYFINKRLAPSMSIPPGGRQTYSLARLQEANSMLSHFSSWPESKGYHRKSADIHMKGRDRGDVTPSRAVSDVSGAMANIMPVHVPFNAYVQNNTPISFPWLITYSRIFH